MRAPGADALTLDVSLSRRGVPDPAAPSGDGRAGTNEWWTWCVWVMCIAGAEDVRGGGVAGSVGGAVGGGERSDMVDKEWE